MLNESTEIFLQFPVEAEKRILLPGRITCIEAQTVVAVFQDTDLPISPGDPARIFFMEDRKFVQLAAEVTGLDGLVQCTGEACAHCNSDYIPTSAASANWGDVTSPPFALRTIGDVVSAETRGTYRVCTVMTNRTAGLGDQDDCLLLDVSATGFAVISMQRYEIGESVTASLNHDGQVFSGQAVVQSIYEVQPGEYRYGLHATAERGTRFDLAEGSRVIATTVQREQLRRIRKAA